MGAPNPAQTYISGDVEVYVGPYTTPRPTNTLGALDAGFKQLGLTTEAGVTLTDGRTVQDFYAAQQIYPVRTIITQRQFTISFELEEWDSDSLAFALGGGDFDTVSDGFEYAPPPPSVIDYRSLVIDGTDGDRDVRVYIPKCLVTDNVATSLTRTNLALLPITARAVIKSSFEPPYRWFFDDSNAFAATAS